MYTWNCFTNTLETVLAICAHIINHYEISGLILRTINNNGFYGEENSTANKHNKKKEKIKKEKSTAPGIPRRTPIQVLTGLDVA